MKTPEQKQIEKLEVEIKQYQEEVRTFKLLSLRILEHRQEIYNQFTNKS